MGLKAFAYLPPCDDKQKADKPRYKCLLSLDNGTKCDTLLVYCGGTTNMATHLRTRQSKYVLERDMKSQTNTLKVDTDKNTLLMRNMAKWTPERQHLLYRKIAYWLVIPKSSDRGIAYYCAVRVHTCMHENMHRDSILKGEQC